MSNIETDACNRTSGAPVVRPGYRVTVARLGGAQKTTKGAPAYSRFVNRPAGRALAAIAHLLGMTPNMVTAVSAAFSFAGVAVLIFWHPTVLTGIVISLCLVLGYAFDAADGQLARLRGGGSVSGEWLDHMVDATKISALHLAVLIGVYRFFGIAPGWWLVPIGFAVVAAVSFFGMILNDQLRRNVLLLTGAEIDRGRTTSLRSLLVMPTDYGLLCIVFVLWGLPQVFFPIYVGLFACNAVFLALASVKWFRDMGSLNQQSGKSS